MRIEPRWIELKGGPGGDFPPRDRGFVRYGRALLDPPPTQEPDRSVAPADAATDGAADPYPSGMTDPPADRRTSDVGPGRAGSPAEAAHDPLVTAAPAESAGEVGEPSAAGVVYACPSCGHEFAVAAPPAGGLVTCAACGAEFFAAAELSDEDRAEAERMELDQQVRAQRLVGLQRNVVLLERRSLFRTRSYVIVAMGVCVVAALQLAIYAAQRWVFQGFGVRVSLYLLTIAAMLGLSWLCLGKIWDLNDEIAKPAQKDPTEPPDFSTLSDGSQVRDAAARNLERLAGGN